MRVAVIGPDVLAPRRHRQRLPASQGQQVSQGQRRVEEVASGQVHQHSAAQHAIEGTGHGGDVVRQLAEVQAPDQRGSARAGDLPQSVKGSSP